MNAGLDKLFLSSKTERWVLALTIVFMLGNLEAMVFMKNYYLALIPIFLVLFYLYFFSVDTLFLIIAVASPLAVNLSDWDSRLAVSIPTEPLLAGLLLIFILKSLYELSSWKDFLRNPVSIAFILYFIWIALSSITSQMPVVSWKFFISHLWLIVPMYFFGTRLFYQKESMQRNFVIAQFIALTFVAIYTLVRHAGYNFGDNESHWVMQPFYKDHAIYGSALALFIPVMFFLFSDKKYTFTQKFFIMVSIVVLLIALLFSYSRAAWLGFAIAVAIGIIVLFRIKFKVLLVAFLTLLLAGLFFQSQILHRLEKNKQDSSEDVVENIESMSNISTDASNLERLNRWNCALRMAAEHPLTGTGPGTYQFLYAPYQFSYEKTIISTNEGTLGNAHSEFLGALAETGVPGMLFVVLLVFSIFYYGFRTYSKLRIIDRSKARFILGLILGLVTYFVHAFMNNFLDSDKIAIPVWGFTAIIVANGIALKNKKTEKIPEEKLKMPR
jgi:putative inorganic carbon (hco3(-)) transporter